ncbi:MAG: hypothetical protein CMM93_06060 [Rickettsiales bacterium]|nr:hypothetical protein [Rickettsiales bacterium]
MNNPLKRLLTSQIFEKDEDAVWEYDDDISEEVAMAIVALVKAFFDKNWNDKYFGKYQSVSPDDTLFKLINYGILTLKDEKSFSGEGPRHYYVERESSVRFYVDLGNGYIRISIGINGSKSCTCSGLYKYE